MLFYRYVPFILIFLLLFSLFYAFFLAPSISTINFFKPKNELNSEDANDLKRLCKDGDTASCTVNSCSGYKSCRNSVWSECIFKKICNPGSKALCTENLCSTGYKICNECGTAYSECTNDK